MKIIGLTGSIASGKSSTARMLKRLRIPVHDSDATAHALMGKDGVATPILRRIFPDCVNNDGGMDRKKLGRVVFEQQPDLRDVLESVLHPLIRDDANRFIRLCQRQRRRYCVIDIPLLFETQGENRFDRIWCMHLPRHTQIRRLMRRRDMTEGKARSIINSQWPQWKKTRSADLVLRSTRGYNHVVRKIKAQLRNA